MSGKKLAQNNYKGSISKILSDLCRNKTPIILWKMYLDRKWTAQLQLKVVRSTQGELLFTVNTDQEAKVKEIINGEKILRFHVEGKNILFQSKLKYLQMPELVVECPKFIAVEELRKDLRLRIENDNCKVVIQKFTNKSLSKNQVFEKKIQDISAGGLSFILSSQEEPYFHHDKGNISAVINLAGQDIIVTMTLVNLITIEPNSTNGLLYKSYKACFKFDLISPSDKAIIADYVLKHYKLTA